MKAAAIPPLEDRSSGGRLVVEGMPTQERAKIDGERDYRQYTGGELRGMGHGLERFLSLIARTHALFASC